jgi:hypothetical protein
MPSWTPTPVPISTKTIRHRLLFIDKMGHGDELAPQIDSANNEKLA